MPPFALLERYDDEEQLHETLEDAKAEVENLAADDVEKTYGVYQLVAVYTVKQVREWTKPS